MSEEAVYSVYIETNTRRGVLYTVVTRDLTGRGRQHREGEIAGFTREWGCKQLVWFEWHGDIVAAIRREKLIKRWRRAWKFDLIERTNPEWRDLLPALMGEALFPGESEFGVRGGTPPSGCSRRQRGFAAGRIALPAVPDKSLRDFPG